MEQQYRRRRRERPPARFSRAWFKRHRFPVAAGGAALLLLLATGLFFVFSGGETVAEDGEDAVAIRSLVSGLPDYAGDAKRFRGAFASGATPPADKERARFRQLLFTPESPPVVSGDSATVRVRVRDDNSPQPLGALEWSFSKEGGKWKIKSAPLP